MKMLKLNLDILKIMIIFFYKLF